MICEQVRELLSAYLDNTLAQEERQHIARHLHTCADCSALLADFRYFDALLIHLPRISPDISLYKKIFSAPEYLELTGTSYIPSRARAIHYTQSRRNDRPHLVALPGGRLPSTPPVLSPPPKQTYLQRLARKPLIQRMLLAAIAAILIVLVSVGNFSGWNLWQKLANVIADAPGITPFTGQLSSPLPAGMRFVFLRDGALWSISPNGKADAARLTPNNVSVAANWTVRTPLPGHPAGNSIAYIDLQQGYVHVIRSNGQNDTTLPQPLLKQGSTAWNTEAGAAILSSLRWSEDGSMLTFVADPAGTEQTQLFLYSVQTERIQRVTLPLKGVISQPAWSPDGVRLAFKLSYGGKTAVFDHNIHTNGTLLLTSTVNTAGNLHDTVLSLDWSPEATTPIITWSVGTTGHIHSIWSRRVGTGHPSTPLQLTDGDYTEASYSRTGNSAYGNWLLISSQAGDLISIDLTGTMKKLTTGKQVSVANWSPDGTTIDYFDAPSSNKGALHIISLATDNATLVATNVAIIPGPVWSHDSQHLAYSTGTQVQIASTQHGSTSSPLKLQGSATVFSWSASSSSQLVLAGEQQGMYLIDIQKDTMIQINKERTNGPIWWTQIP